VRRCNAEATESRSRVNEVTFMAVIEEVRRNGYAVTTGYVSAGRRSIAVPVPSRTGRVLFGIGVAGPIERIEAKRELILQGLRAFQAAMLESDVINNDNASATDVLKDRTCA
jgi:DNA-binding IclR family transcriptional regulator